MKSKNYDLVEEVNDLLNEKTLKLEYSKRTDDIEDEEFAALVCKLYNDKLKEKKLCGVLLNRVYTQKQTCFILSAPMLISMAEEDPNLSNMNVNKNLAYKALRKLKNALIEEIYPPVKQEKGVSKKSGLYRVKHERLREILNAIEFKERQLQKEYEKSILGKEQKESA